MIKFIKVSCFMGLLILLSSCGAKKVEHEVMTTLHAPADDATSTAQAKEDEQGTEGNNPGLSVARALNRQNAQVLQEITMDIGHYHDQIEVIKITSDEVLEGMYNDPRLSGLREHLEQVTYNTEPGKVGGVTSPDSLYVMTNKLNQLPVDYEPIDLREPNVPFSFSGANMKRNLREDAASALEALVGASMDENLTIKAVSGYRSFARQDTIYRNNVANRGVEATDEVSARPGHSEHQTGLAMDVSTDAVGNGLVESFAETPEGLWLKENAHRFGFVIRYPKDYISNTGYNYEPWHIRYIGEGVASFMYENDLTLEMLYATYLQED